MSKISYLETIHSSCSRYPDLVRLSKYLENLALHEELPGRAAVLEFGAGIQKVKGHRFQDVSHLKNYLQGTTGGPYKCRLYILEDLSLPFVEAFGAHFQIDPCLFATQENSAHWTATRHDYTVSRRLPSMQKPDQFYTLRYYEVVQTEEMRRGNFSVVSNVERKVEPSDPRNRDPKGASKLQHFIVRKNASFWSRVRRSGDKDEGWDALVLVDPPLDNSIYINVNQQIVPRAWANQPYGRGYVDFTPWSADIARLVRGPYAALGPPRTSIFDDIMWYWTDVASVEQVLAAQEDAAMGAIFLQNIVASTWNVFLEFIWAKVSEFERELGGFESGKDRQVLSITLSRTLDKVNLYRRRLAWYIEEFEWSLQNLDIAVDDYNNQNNKDFLHILKRLRGCKDKVESVMSVVTGYLSVRQGEISHEQSKETIKESQLVSRLAYLALVFIPLSYIASIFSMGGDYLAGASHFWVYFAIAIPVTTIILVIAWLLHKRGSRELQITTS